MKIMPSSYDFAGRILERIEQIASRIAARARWARWRLGGPFKVRLICCGRCINERGFATYDEADKFRELFMSLPSDGHERVAVISTPN
jgi:hypothetical protein